MADRKLIILVVLLIVLSVGHDIDHIFRGDIRWHLLPVLLLFAKYVFLGLGLCFYLRNKIGPLFWAVTAGLGAALGWLAHFSPFTDQTPQYIFRAYATPASGLPRRGFARRAHAHADRHGDLCGVSLGERVTLTVTGAVAPQTQGERPLGPPAAVIARPIALRGP